MKTSTIRNTLFAFAVLLAALRATAALDLTPISSFKVLEGMKIPVVEFIDGDKRIQYKPPGDWQPVGGGASVKFLPPAGASGASMQLMAMPRKAPEAIPEATDGAAAPAAENLQEWAKQFIPKQAKDIGFVKEVPSPYQLEGITSDEFIFNYTFNGSRESISVSVVDRRDSERLVMIVVARDKDFDTVHSAAISSMFSWKIIKKPGA